jgi:hypothetical protein
MVSNQLKTLPTLSTDPCQATVGQKGLGERNTSLLINTTPEAMADSLYHNYTMARRLQAAKGLEQVMLPKGLIVCGVHLLAHIYCLW